MIKLQQLINEGNEGIKFPSYNELVKIIKSHRLEYKTFGLKALPNSIPTKVGDKLRNSTRWTYDGIDTGMDLGGASTIGIKSLDKKDINKSIRYIKEYISTDSQLILVGGILSKRGQDLGELIIKDGVALYIWK